MNTEIGILYSKSHAASCCLSPLRKQVWNYDLIQLQGNTTMIVHCPYYILLLFTVSVFHQSTMRSRIINSRMYGCIFKFNWSNVFFSFVTIFLLKVLYYFRIFDFLLWAVLYFFLLISYRRCIWQTVWVFDAL